MVLEHPEATAGGSTSPESSRTPSGPSSFPSRSRRGWIIGVLVAAAVVGAVAWIIHHGTQAQPYVRHRRLDGAMAVAVARATVGDIDVKIPALGTVTPLATVTVMTQIAGQLQQIAFKEGQMVRAGDFLAQIDPRPYQAALDQALGNLQHDQALLADARLDLKRYQVLVTQDSIATQTLDTQKALVQQYIGTVASDQALVATARLNLQYTHIVSPVSGRVGLRQVDQGNYITPSTTTGIVVVTQLQPISVLFPVPEDDIPAVMKRLGSLASSRPRTARPARSHGSRPGAAAPGAADPPAATRDPDDSSPDYDVVAFDRSNTTRLAQGKLLTADNEVDTSTGTVKLRALFDNSDYALFPNQFVNIQLLEQVLHDQVIIPAAAIQRGAPDGQTGTFVYLVNADSTVSVHPVKVGVTDGDRVAITAGLSAGDLVVTEGGDRLRDGAPVALPSATPAPAATPAAGRDTHGRKGGTRHGHNHGHDRQDGAGRTGGAAGGAPGGG